MVEDSGRIEELLAFYVNGTLSDEERARVEARLASDTEMQSEERTLRLIRTRMQAEEPSFSPGDLGWARLSAALPAEKTVVKPAFGFKPLAALAASFALGAILVSAISFTSENGQGSEFVQAGVGNPEHLISVAFQPDASLDRLNEFLLDNGLEIVSGPSALGLYQVAASDGTDPEAALMTLRTAVDLVESAGGVD